MFGFGSPQIDVKQIQEEIDSGEAMLVDVRTGGEYQMAHAKGAANVELERILQGEVPVNDTDTKLYVYCASGNRSGMAQQMLKGKGYEVINIGGLGNWQAAGGSVDRG